MTEKNEAMLAEVDRLVRTVDDPAELGAKIRAVVTEVYPAPPAPPFQDGEVMLLHEFERRFKKAYCHGVEPHFAQWPVMVRFDKRENLTVQFGRTLDQVKREIAEEQSGVRGKESGDSDLTPHSSPLTTDAAERKGAE